MILKKKKTLVLKENFQYFNKIILKISKFFTNTFANMSQNIFAYSFVSEHHKHFILILRKKNFLAAGVGRPPPLNGCAPLLNSNFFTWVKGIIFYLLHYSPFHKFLPFYSGHFDGRAVGA